MRKNKYYEKLIDENLVFDDEDTEPSEEDLLPYDPARYGCSLRQRDKRLSGRNGETLSGKPGPVGAA